MSPDEIRTAVSVACPRCHAPRGRRCNNGNGHTTIKTPHKARLERAEEKTDA